MRISRLLNIHKCFSCQKALGDEDFIHCGLSLMIPHQHFFDYLCPQCQHRGRYVLDIMDTSISVAESIRRLSAFIKEEGEP
jgi:hypothetical protein